MTSLTVLSLCLSLEQLISAWLKQSGLGEFFEKDRLASLNLSLFRSVEPVWLVTVSENSSGSVAFLCSHILTFIGFFTS